MDLKAEELRPVPVFCAQTPHHQAVVYGAGTFPEDTPGAVQPDILW